MTNLTLKQLRYADAVARLGHFGRAAEACGISQPALSMQIGQMEAALGGPLFERGARRASLTGLGEALAPRIRDILRSVDELGAAARQGEEDLPGRLRLGVIPTVAPYLLPQVIAALADRSPDLDLQVRETQTARLVGDLHEGRLDAAILALPVGEPGLEEAALFDEAFMLVRPARDAGKAVPGAEGLRALRLLLLEEGHCFRDQALAFCALNPTGPRELLDGSSLSTLVQMVSAGIGVTLIPEMAVGIETRSANVAIDRFADPQPQRTIGMVWRKASPLAPQFLRVADLVRAASLVAERETR